MTTVNVEGHGEFSATEQMTARFAGMKKVDLARKIAEGYGGNGTDGKLQYGVAHWREFPKETLVIVAADMFATDKERKAKVEAPEVRERFLADLERAGQAAADAEPLTLDDGTQNPEAGIAPVDLSEDHSGQHITGPDVPAVEEPAPIAAPAGGKAAYVLKCTHRPGWLRRDQPRKPGDGATYKVVEDISKASVYRTLKQAELKIAEAAMLLDVPAEIAEAVA